MGHVLVIEDNPQFATDIADLAVEAGATSIAFAASPAEAVVSALRRRPVLLLSDVRIQDGNGPAAVKAIRDHYSDLIPAIFITGTPDECEAVEGSTILSKPFVATQLLSLVIATGTLEAHRSKEAAATGLIVSGPRCDPVR